MEAGYQFLSKFDLTPEKVFLVLALTFGIFWTFIVPPFQVPDEPEHVRRAMELSEGVLYPASRGGVRGNEMPASLPELVRSLRTAEITFHYDEKQRVPAVLGSFGIRGYDLRFMPYADKNTDENFYYPSYVPYPPTLYMPQMAAYRLSKLAGLPLILCTYFMRMFNLLFWAALVYCAIRMVPVAKWGMAVLALMPMGVFEAASASADPAINGTAFLYAAIVLRHALDDKQERLGLPTILLLILLPLIFCVGKAVYLPVVLLPLMVPAKSFGSGLRKYSFIAASLVVCGLASYLWEVTFSVSQLLISGRPDEKLRSFLANPSEWLDCGMQSFWGRGMFSPLFAPGKLGWLDTPLGVTANIMAAFLILTAFITGAGARTHEINLSGWHRMFMLSLGGMSSLLIIIVLTIPGPNPWFGVQGRYFIPLGPLVFPVLSPPSGAALSSRMRSFVSACGSVTALFLITVLLVSSTWKLILRYYVI